jgi:TolB-like protein
VFAGRWWPWLVLSLSCAALLIAALAPRPGVRQFVRDAPPGEGGEAVSSIAVLPFTPLGAGTEDAYDGSGMADALIIKLSNSPQIKVRPTSAVMRYVGVAYDPRVAGRALEVDAVLDGKIQRAGDHVRVTVQLIRVRDGAPLWAGTFDEKSGDIFAVEDSISEQVLTALNFKLSREEQGRLRRRQTDNVEAAQAQAKAHYFMNKGTREGLNKGLEYFGRAVELDPALEQIRKTIEMDRAYPPAHEMLGLVYEQKGMRAEAAAEFQEAKRLSGGRVGVAALGYEWAVSGRTEKAREALRELEAQSKTVYVSPYEWAVVRAGLGETREAVAALEQARAEGSLNPAEVRFDPRLDNLRATAAFQDFARRVGLPQ